MIIPIMIGQTIIIIFCEVWGGEGLVVVANKGVVMLLGLLSGCKSSRRMGCLVRGLVGFVRSHCSMALRS